MNRQSLIDKLRVSHPEDFVNEHLFDPVPMIFQGNRETYSKWKRQLGKMIDVDPACILIVGSACVGFSLTPGKDLRAFNDASDIDVAIVSQHHFTIGWRYLRTNGFRRYSLPERMKRAWDDHVNRLIFFGAVATDHLLGVMPFGNSWLSASNRMSSIAPTDGRDVNMRVYLDFDALRNYHVNGIRSLRETLEE